VLYRENYHDSPPFFHQFSRTVCPSSAGQLMPSTGGHYVLAVTFRIQKAKQLLSKVDKNMTDITFELGFQNPVSFSKMFKQHVGISPIEYRKKVILDKM
ncbi:helix-turn-helix domain-containing protein, partial [Brevibacillus borstelensis]|uniref:helix-turn-helix domain-containing protein n=1 Tax=Brevibacillus borstelensis TaxID=45462 RepID=UPI0020423552